MKQLGTAWMMYAQDYDERVVASHQPPVQNPRWDMWVWATPADPSRKIDSRLMPYIKNESLFVCPSGALGLSTYGMNYYFAAGARTELGGPYRGGYGYGGCALAAIGRPAEILVLTDSRAIAGGPCYYIGNASYPGYAWRTAGYICGGTRPRHNEGVNCTFADGHAKWQQGIKFAPVNSSAELRRMLYFWVE